MNKLKMQTTTRICTYMFIVCTLFLLLASTTTPTLAEIYTKTTITTQNESYIIRPANTALVIRVHEQENEHGHGDEHALSRVKRQDIPDENPPPPPDLTEPSVREPEEKKEGLCPEGLVVPLWMPQTNVPWSDRSVRGFVYFILMCYLFVGVSIVSDRFMAAIEEITSQERQVKLRTKSGEETIVTVRVWNETVANLTLMALGSSAPEILLSVIEMFAKNFESGDLGPGTIVGSAAFNLFVIIAICIVVIPAGEVRRIRHLRVFIVTASFSVFAYIWLYLILAIITPGVVDIWESVITFLLFPILVLWAYIAEKRLLLYKFTDKSYHMNKRGVIVSGEREASLEMGRSDGEKDDIRFHGERDTDARDFDNARREYIALLTELRRKNPEAEIEELEMLAQQEMISRGPKSRAFYRIQATRKMIGSGNIMRKIQERAHSDLNEVKAQVQQTDEDEDSEAPTFLYFEPGHYTVMENCGEFEVRVVRRGDISSYTTVEFDTEDGSAEAGTDYVGKKGTITFPPGVDEQRFKVEIIDDEVFEEDVCFYIRLSNPSEPAVLRVPKLATVMILDDDHCGIFGFTSDTYECAESVGVYELKITRFSGARGRVILPYWTEDGTAKSGKDYEPQRGELIFEDNEHAKYIPLNIIEESSYEKDVSFNVILGQPRLSPDDEQYMMIEEAARKNPDELTKKERILLMGQPKPGETHRTAIRIRENEQFKRTVDKLVLKANASTVLGTRSWKEQFRDALTVIPADETEIEADEEVEDSVPSCGDYIMHFLTLFWKIVFAFIPPTGLGGGYLAFIVSIIAIGVLTAIIGDIASYFGCSLGIKDSVTAICFVALGTSIPDTFASKIAAMNDETADNSIGNVTGSNAVNVFLGIGVAWSIASIYHATKGSRFLVEPGSIGFAVAVFCLEASIAITILMLRRNKSVGGELGGPTCLKYICGTVFLLLWIFYILISTLEAYDLLF